LAVNLSDAFTFEQLEGQGSDTDVLEMKAVPPKDLLSSNIPHGGDVIMENGTEAAVAGGQVVNP
jgi:hypothetical protein